MYYIFVYILYHYTHTTDYCTSLLHVQLYKISHVQRSPDQTNFLPGPPALPLNARKKYMDVATEFKIDSDPDAAKLR